MPQTPPPEIDGVAHRYVEAAGARLHVAEAGEGPPVVLLHGWPQHWWVWRKLIPALAEERRVICPDLRGFGWSDAPTGSYELSGFAADTLALFDALGLDRVELVGHDWGGYSGFLLCLEAPERVAHFLALGVVHPWFEAPSPSLQVLKRLGYQFVLATPGLGSSVLRHNPAFVRTVLVGGFEPYAAEMSVAEVEGAGHFIAEERPDVVLANARELFGPAAS